MLTPTTDHKPTSVPGSNVQVIFGPGALSRLPHLVRSLSASRILLVTDDGIKQAGHVEHALRSLYQSDLVVRVFDETIENPTTHTVAKGLRLAMEMKPDLIVGLGGGSSMDTAKGVNFILTNGGRMQDYWGTNKASRPMLPMIAIPTTAGTGSEAQSYALITDPETHQKMACGDQKALPTYAVLDPELTRTQPKKVAAATGIDAVAHAVETAACNQRNDVSRRLSREAWALLESGFDHAMLNGASDEEARQKMLLGAHLAGCAIENSMLGAAHSCANPLTAHFDITHGLAVGVMLPHVIRFNAAAGENPYADLSPDADALAQRVEAMLNAVDIPSRLSDLGVRADGIPAMAEMATKQWTANFNPRKLTRDDFVSLYQAAL